MKKKLIATVISGLMLTTAISPSFANNGDALHDSNVLKDKVFIGGSPYFDETTGKYTNEESKSAYVPKPVLNEKEEVIGHTRSLPVPILYKENINVVVNNKVIPMDVKPVIENDRTLVPLRAIFEALGAEVKWDEVTKTVYGTKGDKNISLKIGDKVAKINNKEVTLDVPAKIFNGRTLIPVRFISEALGMDVEWDEKTQTVTLKGQGADNNFDETVELYESTGVVKSIQKDKNGILALVEEKGEYKQIKFNINYLTTITNAQGYRLDINDIKEGSAIKVYYGSIMAQSSPPVALAEKVVVEDVFCNIGKIESVSKTKNGVSILLGDKTMPNSSIVYNIGKETEIVDVFGKKLSLNDIKEGAEVKAFSGPVMTMSLPPQTYATKIVVDVPCTEGEINSISKTEHGTSVLIGDKKASGMEFNEIVLYIDKAKIVNESGKELKIDDLKEGMKVKAYYGPAMTRSLPPIGTAEKLVVSE